MFCQFVFIKDNTYKCINCDNQITVIDEYNEPPMMMCRAYIVKQESMLQENVSFSQKVKNFASSLYGHIKNNMELCPDHIIEKRYDICKSCEYFKDSTCTKCGCPLIRDRAYISKLAWSNEACPINRWTKWSDQSLDAEG
jgi:hypothetical protein